MTRRKPQGKDLATIPGKELAIIASPCPSWDAEIKNILNQINTLHKDHTVFPDDRKAGRQFLTSELRRRVDKLDNGQWIEAGQVVELPEPWPRNDTWPGSVWELLNRASEAQRKLTPDEMAWIDSVTDTTIR